MKKRSLAHRLCRCIKSVRKGRTGTRKQKEKAAIAICVTSVLHSRKKALKRFHCKPKPFLHTQ
jgi:hypothetical protein